MIRLILIYVFVFLLIYLIYTTWSRKKNSEERVPSSKERFRSKTEKGLWVQVYDTGSLEDATRVIARLEEEELNCVMYEKGKKDVQGNAMNGFGVVVPRSAVSRAQTVISRIPA